jgi:excisionase family DNA binding protein
VDRSPLDDSYCSLRQLSAYSGLSSRTLRKKIIDALHPLPFYRIGGKILVRRSEYDAWALRFRVTNPLKADAMVNELLKEL